MRLAIIYQVGFRYMENDIVIKSEKQRKGHSIKTYLFIAAIGLLIIGVTVFILTTFMLPYDDNIIEIIGYDNVGYVPNETKSNFSAQLYNQLKTNFDIPYQRGAVKATIRPDTYTQDIGTVTTISFIVDIDDFQQTYQTSLMWTDSEIFIPENVVLKCTKKELAKYPDAVCHGMYDSSNSISLYLPYETTLESGEKISLQKDYIDSDGIQVMKVLVDNCGNQNIKAQALAKAKEYIDSLDGFNANDYEYNVPSVYNNCIVR